MISTHTLRRRLFAAFAIGLSCVAAQGANAADSAVESFDKLSQEFDRQTSPLLREFCLKCHTTKDQQGDLDLERFGKLNDVRKDPKAWLKVVEMLDNGEMPPKDAKQPTPEQRAALRGWADRYLKAEAYANAGDPGPVLLRRLNNAEYTYTIRDLTGVPLSPAKEFPVDGAAGEGFTNTGNSLVMSPALLAKYLDAGKEVSQHAMLLSDGIRFSPSSTRSDWTNDALARIREIYAKHSSTGGASQVNLQGIVFNTNDGGRLPVEKYIAVTIAERQPLEAGQKTLADVAKAHGLNAKYLGILWAALHDKTPSPLLDKVRAEWQAASPADADRVSLEIAQWQSALWRFTTVGHIGKVNGPKSWQEAVSPIVPSQELRIKLAKGAGATPEMTTLHLTAGDSSDGSTSDFVVWQQPRLVAPGRPDLMLKDLRAFTHEMQLRRQKMLAETARILAAAAEISAANPPPAVSDVASKHQVDVESLSAWLDYLGIGTSTPIKLDLYKNKIEKASNYDFVSGWSTADLPIVVANSSDQHVRIPGNLRPHGVCVHPTPTLNSGTAWKSPIQGALKVDGVITHAHPECGNGVVWTLELRRGSTRQRLATGIAQGGKPVPFGPIEDVHVRPGDMLALLIGPRDGNHSCDLTDIDLTIRESSENGKTWNLSQDVSPNIFAGNPHADLHGNAEVWHFYSEPISGAETGPVIPNGSLLSRWQAAEDPAAKGEIAAALEKLLTTGPEAGLDANHPDAVLYRQLSSLGGPLVIRAWNQVAQSLGQKANSEADKNPAGVDPALFGKHPDGTAIDPNSLCVKAPAIVTVNIPSDLADGAELVVTGSLDARTSAEGSAQLEIMTQTPSEKLPLKPGIPVIATGKAAAKLEAAFSDFRNLFPSALCYTKIVPVDEVVTLTLFYREDEQLCRLMLDDQQKKELDATWEELHFVSNDALTLVDAFLQLLEYASQDADPKVFEPMRKPIYDRAEKFKQQLLAAEPKHLEAVIKLADQAYRRPITSAEKQELLSLYKKLREQELPHEDAIRYLIARVFVSPSFLYRLENSPNSPKAMPVSDWELASRLSYFLWSSMPDAELRAAAANGSLRNPDVLAKQTRRMLQDPKVRRLSTEFACQWLHIYDFDTLDEKSETHFPDFVSLRGDMYEESILFFTDFFQNDGSVLSIFDADHTFVNKRLADFYGIAGVSGDNWQKVTGLRQMGRGGVLGQATTLAKQSGASRTSPILRGNWVSEVLLGEKLPKPPKDVPPLPDEEPSDANLSVRQLVESHSIDPRCSSCHVKIDPFGFALESFDAIGRRRKTDEAKLALDTKSKLPDGTEIAGMAGLRSYLAEKRQEAVVRQFCRKLLGYSLGRATQLSDEPLLTEIQTKLKSNGFHISVALDAIVRSPQFREIRGNNQQVADSP